MSEYAVMPLQDYKDVCNAIREKTDNTETINSKQLPEQVNSVYKAGQDSMVDQDKIILKTVKGEGSVTLTEVSEVPHSVTVRAGSKTVESDGVVYTATGDGPKSKNLLTYPYEETTLTINNTTFKDLGDGSIEISGIPNKNCSFILQRSLPFEDGKTYTLSVKGGTYSSGVLFTMCYLDENGAELYNSKTITWKKEYTLKRIYLQIYTNFSGISTRLYPQVEEGSVATSYTPNKWYTIEGIPSNSPTMTITGEYGIEADYHKSWGIQAEYDRFWDSFQTNGNRVNYAQGFAGVCWDDDTYNPKYPIIVTNIATNMYNNNTRITSTKVPITIDTASATNVFQGATRLKEIPEIKVTEKVSSYSNWFVGCSALESINFTDDSVIANNISFSDCALLTHDSLISIINALKDYSGTTTTRTLTLHATSKALLTDTEKAIATDKGWILA